MLTLGLAPAAAEFTGDAFAGSQGQRCRAEANAGVAACERRRGSVCTAFSGAARKGRISFTHDHASLHCRFCLFHKFATLCTTSSHTMLMKVLRKSDE